MAYLGISKVQCHICFLIISICYQLTGLVLLLLWVILMYFWLWKCTYCIFQSSQWFDWIFDYLYRGHQLPISSGQIRISIICSELRSCCILLESDLLCWKCWGYSMIWIFSFCLSSLIRIWIFRWFGLMHCYLLYYQKGLVDWIFSIRRIDRIW